MLGITVLKSANGGVEQPMSQGLSLPAVHAKLQASCFRCKWLQAFLNTAQAGVRMLKMLLTLVCCARGQCA